MATQYNTRVPQGTTKVVPFQVTVLTDPTLPFDEITNPRIPLDLTTAAIQMQVRRTYNTSTVDLTCTDLNGRIIKTDAINGEFELKLDPADTTSFKFDAVEASYLYDIEAKFSTANILRIAQGEFIVEREITRIA